MEVLERNPNVVGMDALIEKPSINDDGSESDSDCSFHEGEQRTKKRILFNLCIFSLCYFLAYTGFWALSNLQSTMNAEGGLGDDSQAAIYIFSMLSSLFLPKLFIERFGCKKVIVFGNIICCIYMASNCYLRWDTMITASIMFGLINGPYLSAVTVYVDELATRYQPYVTENEEFVMASFFGLYTFFSENTQIWGNVISYFVLGYGNHHNATSNNVSHLECGMHFSPSSNSTNANLEPPTEGIRLVLVGAYVFLGVLSVVIPGWFLDPLHNDINKENGFKDALERVIAAIKFLRNPHQLLLIPLTVFIGMEGPFYSNEFTAAYIACAWGVHHVGFVTICFGVCGALTSLLVGTMVKYTSMMFVIILGFAGNIAMCVVLYIWEPSSDATFAFFLVAGVWGMGDAIWWSQVAALYGLMFPHNREAAFSNLYFWSFLGFFLSYAYANYFSIMVKINILIVFLVTGIAGYLIGQIRLKCVAKREYVELPDGEE